MSATTFLSWALALTATVTLVWPLNIPLAALAYKVRNGYAPIPLEAREFWIRSTLASLGLFGFSLVLVGLTYVLVDRAGLPAEIMDLVLLMGYVPAGAWFFFWIFSLEDMFQGLAVFLVYVLLPALPVYLIARLTGFWTNVSQAAPWLLIPSSGASSL